MIGKMVDVMIDLKIGSPADLLVHKNSRVNGIAKIYSDNFLSSGGLAGDPLAVGRVIFSNISRVSLGRGA